MQTTQFSNSPKPPSLHWALVLLLTIVTFGLFGLVWMYIQARFARQLDPANRAPFQVLVCALLVVVQIVFGVVVAVTIVRGGQGTDLSAVMTMLRMFEFILIMTAYWQIRATLTKHYGVELNGVLTVLFNVYYVQYHLSKLAGAQGIAAGSAATMNSARS
jgi:hypothetical protein